MSEEEYYEFRWEREYYEPKTVEDRLERLEYLLSIGDSPNDAFSELQSQVQDLEELVESLSAEVKELKSKK